MALKEVKKSQFEKEVLAYLQQIETSGETNLVTENGRPTVEIRRYHPDRGTPLEKLKASFMEYKEPTQTIGEGYWKD